jgi:predicted transcriptional regulator
MPVSAVMGRPFPQLDVKAEIDSVYKQFKLGSNMVILTRDGKAAGVLTKFDMVSHLRSASPASSKAEADSHEHKKSKGKVTV